MHDFPRADTPDHCEYERPARFKQPGAFTRHVRQIGHAIERAEIGIRAVIDAFAGQALQFVSADCYRLHKRCHVFSFGTIPRPLHHLWRPVGCRDVMA